MKPSRICIVSLAAVILAACGGGSSPGTTSGSVSQTAPSPVAGGPPASASCAVSVAGNPGAVPGSGGRFTLIVTTASACAWTAKSDVGWVSVTPDSGIGSAAPVLVVEENLDVTNSRSANVTVGGQVLHISQGIGCSYTLDTTTLNFSPDESRAGVMVGTRDGCAWTATATDSSWVRVSPARGSGNDLVTIEVTANFGGERHATATIAGKRVAITQQGR